MKAIILAAGEGSRLRPYTENRPKCLVPLEGRSLLDWQISVLRDCGIKEIIVVKGYMGSQITRADVKYYENKDWARTNMLMTLWCAETELDGEVLVSYGDIIYHHRVLKALMESIHDISVTVDLGWEEYWRMRFDDPLEDAESLVMDKNNKILSIGQPVERLDDIQAQYMGLIKFTAAGVQTLKASFIKTRELSKKGACPWGRLDGNFNQLFMTDMLQGLIDDGHQIYGIPVKRGWLEIDGVKDFEIAKREFQHQVLS
jgi:L-glutamine-phosphate cytidylyltransferase